jgi:site-specific recombinase XerD
MRNFVDELGLPAGLDLHSFRRAYATNLQIEYAYDVSFVQLRLGHEHASTTSIYTLAAPELPSPRARTRPDCDPGSQ